MRLRTILLAWAMAFSGASSALAVDWGQAPLACLPSRAERWKDASKMKPCHCPPQSYCPEVIPLAAHDINFIVNVNLLMGGATTYKFTAAELEGMTDQEAQGLFTKSEDELAKLIDDRGPGSVNSVGLSDTHGKWYERYITLYISKNMSGIEAWENDTLEMPSALASICCDSVCPAGTAPVMSKTAVNVTEKGTKPAPQDVIDRLQDEYDLALKEKKEYDAAMTLYLAGGGRVLPAQTITIANLNKKVTEAAAALAKAKAGVDYVNTSSFTANVLSCQALTKHFSSFREGCILEGTEVVLADGTRKPIEQLNVGDELKGHKGVNRVQAINRFSQQKDTLYGINGGKGFISPEHPILTVAGWKAVDPSITSVESKDIGVVGKLKAGDEIITADGTIKVKTIDKYEQGNGATVLNLGLDGDRTFIANDVVVHGFKKVQIHY